VAAPPARVHPNVVALLVQASLVQGRAALPPLPPVDLAEESGPGHVAVDIGEPEGRGEPAVLRGRAYRYPHVRGEGVLDVEDRTRAARVAARADGDAVEG